MAKIILFGLLSVLLCVSAQRITTIHLDGVQYFISRMNPYSPELNYFLAYQYCRSLGLQLASFETKEKAESMTTYLKNAGYGNYDFWTSGNRLGTGMFLWMSTGLPFNATFDFFENSGDAIQTSLLDANDHNSNTAPQRTARDSSSGSEKGCVILKQPSLKWMPEDCSAVKDFICEQTRCYYYNYGSIPVSSAQGRPITTSTTTTTTTTTPQPRLIQQQSTATVAKTVKITTPLPLIMSTYAYEKQLAQQQQQQQQSEKSDIEEDESQPSFMSLNLQQESQEKQVKEEEQDIEETAHDDADEIPLDSKEEARELQKPEQQSDTLTSAEDAQNTDEQDEQENNASELEATENGLKFVENKNQASANLPEVDERVKQISHKIEKIVSNEQMYPLQHHPHAHFMHQDTNNDDDDLSRQSFLSLTDLIRTLRPNDKQIIPQIDSDYSNAMRVLGENSGPLVKTDEQPSRGNLKFRDM